MERLFKAIYWLYGKITFFAALLAGVATFLIMCLIALSAFLRTFINAPIPASVEISQALLVLCITFPFAFTLMKRDHVQTVVLTQHFSKAAQRAIFLAWMVLGIFVFGCMTWGTWNYGMRSYSMNEMVWGAAIQFPLWPSKVAVSIGMGLLTIQFALEALGALILRDFASLGTDPVGSDTILEQSDV